jgi:hypothetical protein
VYRYYSIHPNGLGTVYGKQYYVCTMRYTLDDMFAIKTRGWCTGVIASIQTYITSKTVYAEQLDVCTYIEIYT